jgi:hypothetical protein
VDHYRTNSENSHNTEILLGRDWQGHAQKKENSPSFCTWRPSCKTAFLHIPWKNPGITLKLWQRLLLICRRPARCCTMISVLRDGR